MYETRLWEPAGGGGRSAIGTGSGFRISWLYCMNDQVIALYGALRDGKVMRTLPFNKCEAAVLM